MEQVLLFVYVLLATAMVALILLQQGRGADMGASFGAGASQTVFGAAGTGNVLTRSTAILATLFFIASVGLAVMAKHKAEDLRTGGIPVPASVETRDNAAAPQAPVIPAQAGAVSDIPVSASSDVPAEAPVSVPVEAKPGTEEIPSGK
jgi:preprotein translocase subunit SecG